MDAKEKLLHSLETKCEEQAARIKELEKVYAEFDRMRGERDIYKRDASDLESQLIRERQSRIAEKINRPSPPSEDDMLAAFREYSLKAMGWRGRWPRSRCAEFFKEGVRWAIDYIEATQQGGVPTDKPSNTELHNSGNDSERELQHADTLPPLQKAMHYLKAARNNCRRPNGFVWVSDNWMDWIVGLLAEVDATKQGGQREVIPKHLPDNRIDSVCMTFRHDFGLLDEHVKNEVRETAKRWYDAIQKEINEPSTMFDDGSPFGDTQREGGGTELLPCAIINQLRMLGTGFVGSCSGAHSPLLNAAADLIERLCNAGYGPPQSQPATDADIEHSGSPKGKVVGSATIKLDLDACREPSQPEPPARRIRQCWYRLMGQPVETIENVDCFEEEMQQLEAAVELATNPTLQVTRTKDEPSQPATDADIRGAIARAWCRPETSHKEMDVILGTAIAQQLVEEGLVRQPEPAAGEVGPMPDAFRLWLASEWPGLVVGEQTSGQQNQRESFEECYRAAIASRDAEVAELQRELETMTEDRNNFQSAFRKRGKQLEELKANKTGPLECEDCGLVSYGVVYCDECVSEIKEQASKPEPQDGCVYALSWLYVFTGSKGTAVAFASFGNEWRVAMADHAALPLDFSYGMERDFAIARARELAGVEVSDE